MRPYVDEDKCIACGACHDVCPAEPNVFEVTDKSHVINPDACIACGACESSCPTSAIVLED